MTATSETQIANLALTRIGHNKQISSLDEGTVAADLCKLHYPMCRDTLLRAHTWRFAIKRVALSALSASPAFEFAYAYPLPADFMRLIRTDAEATGFSGAAVYGYPGVHGYAESGSVYRVESFNGTRCLLSNESAVSIEYVARVSDVAQFDPMFVDVLAQFVASNICMALADNASLAETVMAIYKDKLSDARSTGAMEGTPREVIDTSGWLVARA